MTLIDLDRPAESPERPPGPRWRPRLVLPIAVALLSVFTVTGATRPAGAEPPRERWSLDVARDDVVTVAGDVVLRERTVELPKLIAYDLATGEPLWDTGTTAYGRVVPEPADGLVLLVDEAGPGRPGRTTARRIADGATVWRQPGALMPTARGTALVADPDADGRVARLRRLRITDGTQVWSRDIAPADSVQLEYAGLEPADRVITASGGKISLYRYADGSPAGSGTVPFPPGGLLGSGHGMLYVESFAGSSLRLTAYDLTTFRRVGRVESPGGLVFDCGSLVCRFDQGMSASDLTTGRVVWQRAGVSSPSVITGDRLLLRAPPDETQTLIATDTGRVVADRIPGVPAISGRTETSVLMVFTTTDPAERTAVGRLDLTTGAWRVLGLIPTARRPYQCEPAGDLLLCQEQERLFVTGVPG